MRGSRSKARPLAAALTALLLVVFAAPDLPVEVGAAHGHAHGSPASGWVQRTGDHAPHDFSQLEPAATVRHAECAVCAGRVRPHDSVLGLVALPFRQDARAALPLAVRAAVATLEASPGQPRAPPIV